jgi:hypothetical protein
MNCRDTLTLASDIASGTDWALLHADDLMYVLPWIGEGQGLMFRDGSTWWGQGT